MRKIAYQLGEWTGLIVGGITASFIMLATLVLTALMLCLPILVILLVLSPLWAPFAIAFYFIFKN